MPTYRQRYYPTDYPATIDGTPKLAEMVSERLPLTGTVLDIGAGRGIDSHPCRRPGITLIGIDESGDIKKNRHIDSYIIQSADSVPLEDQSVDLVFSDFAVEHFTRPQTVLREVRRVLKIGGYFVFRTVNVFHYVAICSILMPDTLRDLTMQLVGRKPDDCFPTLYRLNSKRSITSALQETGFDIEQMLHIEGPPDYLSFSGPLYRLGVAYERLANSSERFRFLRSNIIVAARKVADAG